MILRTLCDASGSFKNTWRDVLFFHLVILAFLLGFISKLFLPGIHRLWSRFSGEVISC